MSSSVQRELEEIEHRRKVAQIDKGSRRGSSIFATADDNDENGPYGRPGYLTKPGDLLVDFPDEKSHDQYSQYTDQSSSSMYLANDSQHSDGLIISGKMMANSYGYAQTKPRLGEAARMQELANSQDLPGGINHRPLVGGFAAAAYEAARAHHYSVKKEDTQGGVPRDIRPPPPCI
jgi:hypothetical protein|eukprot:37703_1